MPMPPGWWHIHRIRLAPSADAADCRQALLVGVKSAIGRAAEPAVVISAPWTIGVSRLADRSRHDQSAEKAEREFHRFFASLSAEQRPIVNWVHWLLVRTFHTSILLKA